MSNEKTLKYELTQIEVQYLQSALEKVQFSGVQNAQNLVHMINKLKNPVNSDDLEKEVLDELKAKYEKPTKEKK